MPSTYSSLLRLELMATGEKSATWGDITNTNLGTLLEKGIAGTASADVTAGNVTLTSLNGADDQARCMIISVTGTPGVSRNVVAPSSSKVYVVLNGSNAPIVFKGSATTGTTIPAGTKAVVAWTGSDFASVSLPFDGSSVYLKTAAVNAVKLESTTARGSGSVVMALYDPSGAKGYFGYGSPNDKLQIYQGLNADVEVYVNGSQQFRITSAGQLYANNIHNNGSGATGTTPMLASGTYNPTGAAVSNCSGVSGGNANWSRVGNVVTVHGDIGLTVTSASSASSFGISLPIASNFTGGNEAQGQVVLYGAGAAPDAVGALLGDTVNDRAQVFFYAPASSAGVNYAAYFTFSYVVQ